MRRKIIKFQIKLVISLFVVFAFFGTNSYAGKFTAGATQKPAFHLICPDGWVIVSGQPNKAHECKPKTPLPITCPKGTSYFEKDCLVGCLRLPH